MLVASESEDTAGSTNNDVGSVEALHQLNMVVDGLSTVNNFTTDVFHEFSETSELVLNLVGKFASVAHDNSRAGLGIVSDVLKDGQDEHCGLAHSRDGLAEDVNAEDGVRNATLLNVGGVLKSAISNGLL